MKGGRKTGHRFEVWANSRAGGKTLSTTILGYVRTSGINLKAIRRSSRRIEKALFSRNGFSKILLGSWKKNLRLSASILMLRLTRGRLIGCLSGVKRSGRLRKSIG